MPDLFRKEAVEHATRRLEGEVILFNILPVRLLIAAFLIVIAIACAFALSASYARKETVSGWLTPDSGLIRALAPQGGLIATLHVKEGDMVLAGASLAELQLAYGPADDRSGLDPQSGQSTYVVTSPINGRVAALLPQPGQTLAAGGLVAIIVPQDSQLIAELYVPSRAAGFIREGQDVRLMYQAFPHQQFGAGTGRIVDMGGAILNPGDISSPGIPLAEPVFRTRVELTNDYVEAYGERIPLQPGMVLTADIVIDRRTLWEWLLDPLYAAGRR